MSDARSYPFDPSSAGGEPVPLPRPGEQAVAVAWRDAGGPGVYVFSPTVILAVNVALVTQRPLLVEGEPGVGKTTLAASVARVLGWWCYQKTVTSRTQAVDLLWHFDALRRLNDANTRGAQLRSNPHYVEPGPLWWAFDPESARHRGKRAKVAPSSRAVDPGVRGKVNKAVVLVDEIDKADPDVPNDLLQPIDVKRFTVLETGDEIQQRRDALLVLTTNRERELPPAFVRRCVALTLEEPDQAWFEAVAARHDPAGDRELHRRLAKEVMRLREHAERRAVRKPSTAEFLDAVRACAELGLDTTSPRWHELARGLLWKVDEPVPEGSAAA